MYDLKSVLDSNLFTFFEKIGAEEALVDFYVKNLGVEKEKARKIIREKLQKKADTIKDLIDEDINSGVLKSSKKNSDVSLDEYLKDKKVIKG